MRSQRTTSLFSVNNGIFLFASLAVFLFLSFSHSYSFASDRESQRKEEQFKIKQQIKENQIKIQRLDSGLEDRREVVDRSSLKEKGILVEIEELDTKLHKMGERLNDLELQMKNQQQLIDQKEEELDTLKIESNRVQLHMQKRIGAYYKLGKIDLVNITFSTQTMPDLLRFHDAFQAVIHYDQQVMRNYHHSIEDLERTKEALSLERGLLEEFISQANDKEQSIKATRHEKALLLNRIKTQTSLHQQAIKEIEQAKADLAASLLAMRKKEKFFDQGFLLNKGKHISPLKGTVISLFNQERYNEFGIKRINPGIAITAVDGAKIVSIFEGRVIYSGYLKGFGNTVIIDHGYQYFTITSRIERLVATKGTKVRRNDIIGIMGSTATILDDGLYFEIRHNDEPQDPLAWLDRQQLKFDKGAKP